MALVDSETCKYCDKKDTPGHTILECTKWKDIRQRYVRQVGHHITANNIISHMLASEDKWKIIEELITTILKEKERDEN